MCVSIAAIAAVAGMGRKRCAEQREITRYPHDSHRRVGGGNPCRKAPFRRGRRLRPAEEAAGKGECVISRGQSAAAAAGRDAMVPRGPGGRPGLGLEQTRKLRFIVQLGDVRFDRFFMMFGRW